MKPNLPLCLLGALLTTASKNRAHAQEVLLHHQGATDPVSEGFVRQAANTGPTNDLGRDAWWVASVGSPAAYRYALSPAQQSQLAGADAMLSFTTRIRGFTFAAHTASAGFFRNRERFWIGLDMQADGDPIVCTGDSRSPVPWIYEGGGPGYHDYQFIHHAATATASLWVDGVERVNGIKADTDGGGFGSFWGVIWGSPSQGEAGFSYWSDLSLTVIPEPSSLAVVGLGAMCLGVSRLSRPQRTAKP